METPSAVTLNVNIKLTPPAPTAAPAPAPIQTSSDIDTTDTVTISSPVDSSGSVEIADDFYSPLLALLTEVGIPNSAYIARLTELFIYRSDSDRESLMQDLMTTLSKLSDEGLIQPYLTECLLIAIIEKGGDPGSVRLAVERLPEALIALREAGITDPVEITTTAMQIVYNCGPESYSAFLGLPYATSSLIGVGINDPEAIKSLILHILSVPDKHEATEALPQIGNVLSGLIEDLGIIDARLLINLLYRIVDVSQDHIAQVFDMFECFTRHIDQIQTSDRTAFILQLIKCAVAWNDKSAIEFIGLQIRTLIELGLTNGDLILEVTARVNPHDADRFEELYTLVSEDPPYPDQGILDQTLEMADLLFNSMNIFELIEDNIERNYELLLEARDCLSEAGLAQGSDPPNLLPALMNNSGKHGSITLEHLPHAVEALNDAGITDPTELAKLLLEISSYAGEWAGYTFQYLELILDICQERGLDIRSLTDAEKVILFGLNYSRFSEDGFMNWMTGEDNAMEEIINNRLNALYPGFIDPRPLAVVIYPEADWNQAFSMEKEAFDDLIDKGYRVMYYEASTDSEFITAFNNATANGKASLVLIGGHGDKATTALGSSDPSLADQSGEVSPLIEDPTTLDLEDEAELRLANLNSRVEEHCVIVSVSCSTGEGGAGENNIANMWGRIFMGHKVFAPTSKTNLTGFVWSNDQIAAIQWTNENVDYVAHIDPPPTQTGSQP